MLASAIAYTVAIYIREIFMGCRVSCQPFRCRGQRTRTPQGNALYGTVMRTCPGLPLKDSTEPLTPLNQQVGNLHLSCIYAPVDTFFSGSKGKLIFLSDGLYMTTHNETEVQKRYELTLRGDSNCLLVKATAESHGVSGANNSRVK